MKKLILTLLVLMLGLVIALPASANKPVDDLGTLAQYAPAETIFFGAIRIDEDYIETMEDLVNARIEILNEAGAGIDPLDIDFLDEIRPWAGETLAIFVPSIEVLLQGESNMPVVIALEVSDFDAAVAFFDEQYEFDLDFGDLEKIEQEDGSVLYNPTVSFLSPTLVTEDFVITGLLDEAVLPGADALRLTNTPEFQDVIEALPEDAYNAMAYINPGPVVEAIDEFGPAMLGSDWPELDVEEINDVIGQQAFGLTLLEDRVFVLDYAQTSEEMPAGTPLDLAMLDRLPADTALLIHGNGLGNTISGMLDSLYLLNDYLVEEGILPASDLGPLDFLGPDDIATFVTLSLEGTYNLDLEATLDWMNGDHALFVRPNYTGEMMNSGVEVGFVLNTNNPEATANLVTEIANDVMQQFNPATFEDGTLSIPLGAVFSMPELGILKITSNDEYLAFGTGDTVDLVLGDDDALSSTDNYAFESGLFIENPDMLWYIDMGPIRDALMPLLEDSDMVDESQMNAINTVLGLVDTSSITSARVEGATTARFTITLSE